MNLVSGATGNVGREVVAALAAADAPVRALTRRPPEGGGPWPDGVEVAMGDLNDPASLSGALAGVRGLFLLSGYDDVAGLLAAGRDAGLERASCCSPPAPWTMPPPPPPNPATTRRTWWCAGTPRPSSPCGSRGSRGRPCARTGSTPTRCAGCRSSKQATSSAACGADVPIASIDPADIGAVAAAALTADGHDGRALRLTGRPARSFHDWATSHAAAFG